MHSAVLCFSGIYFEQCYENCLASTHAACKEALQLQARCTTLRRQAGECSSRLAHMFYFERLEFDPVLDTQRRRARAGFKDVLPLALTQRGALQTSRMEAWRCTLQIYRLPLPEQWSICQRILQIAFSTHCPFSNIHGSRGHATQQIPQTSPRSALPLSPCTAHRSMHMILSASRKCGSHGSATSRLTGATAPCLMLISKGAL